MFARVIIFLAFSYSSTTFAPPKTCNFGVGKCPGMMERDFYGPPLAVPPLKQFSTQSYDECTVVCAYNSFCWLVTFVDNTCKLYPRDTPVSTDTLILTYKWKCCAEASSCRDQPYRCRGFWLKKQWKQIEKGFVIKRLEKANQGCLDECMDSLVCSAVNVNSQFCELLEFQYSYKVSMSLNESVDSYQWHCCSRNDTNLPSKYRSVTGKCRGRWQVDKEKPSESHLIAGIIFSTGKSECMTACETNPFCSKVYLNQTRGFCLMMSSAPALPNGSECSGDKYILRRGHSWFGYSWTCKDASQPPIQPVDPNEPSNYGTCVYSNISADAEVAGDGCTKPLLSSTLAVSSELAAYWWPGNRQKIVDGRNWNRVFNGEIHLWLAGEITECPTENCHQYSTIIGSDSCPEIVSRSSWFARPPTKPMKRFSQAPKKISLSNSVCPRHGCYSIFSCGTYLREMQKAPIKPSNKADLPYNFLIGDDGRVYEGRGADFIGSHSKGYDPQSLGIAFIGWYERRRPTVASLVAVRRLLKCLVKRGKLTSSYELYGQRDLRPMASPGYFLYELMPNWGHYYDQRLPIGLPCAYIRLREILLTCATSVGSVLISGFVVFLIVMYVRVYSHAVWCPLRRSRSKKVRNTRLLTSVGKQNVLADIVNDLPSNCTTRDPQALHVQPEPRILIIVTNKYGDCDCSRFFQLLWKRCFLEAEGNFAIRLSQAAGGRRCSSYSVLLLTNSLFLFHCRDVEDIKIAIQTVSQNRCLCSMKSFSSRAVPIPILEQMPVFSPNNFLRLQRTIQEGNVQEHDSSADLCCYKNNEDEEELYSDYLRNRDSRYDEAVVLDMSAQSEITPLLG